MTDDATPPECRRLLGELRSLRERSGHSLAALAAVTPYSKSSWGRYLSGAQPVPRAAVVALCQVAGERPARLLALWELADAVWSGRGSYTAQGRTGTPGAPAAPAETGITAEPVARPSRRRRSWWLLVAGAVLAVVAGAGAGVKALAERAPPAAASEPDAGPWRQDGPLVHGCTGPGCDGLAPGALGCDRADAVATLAEHRTEEGRRVQVRYGRDCRALWARASGLRAGDRFALRLPGAPVRTAGPVGEEEAAGYLATLMTGVSGPGAAAGATACLLPVHGPEECAPVR
ncbi:helix-turn-helix domain-containing protein [Streptomyces sp. NA13]|uniref:helix-turn-helix domain-containing protein n=1 Tax=Streptomyces sp. NA13 TaxID=2996051 RepID=UPI00226F9574|nr:XRE family transcriptional regulator [Streptomyces sp. NA13]WAC96507.1 helix-turn-helix domain-containing protein [Streptomyces sp. NA13]